MISRQAIGRCLAGIGGGLITTFGPSVVADDLEPYLVGAGLCMIAGAFAWPMFLQYVTPLFVKHIAWRFRLRQHASVPHQPDVSVEELIKLLMAARGQAVTRANLELARAAAQHIADLVSVHRLAVWGRRNGGPLQRIPPAIAQKGFGIGMDTEGQISHVGPERSILNQGSFRYSDLRLCRAEVAKYLPIVT